MDLEAWQNGRTPNAIGPWTAAMKELLKAFLAVSSAQSQRFGAHRSRLRLRHHAVSSLSRGGALDQRPDARRISTAVTVALAPRRSRPRRRGAHVGGAQAVGAAHLRALPAARRVHRARSDGADRGAEARSDAAGASHRAGDGTAARDSPTPSRSAAAIARFSSCSTPRACA